MGPSHGGVNGVRAHGLADARRWRDRLEHAWGVVVGGASERSPLDRRGLVGELELGLELIDFPEVSPEDRVTFLEHAVAWQVRRALAGNRFDLALELEAWGAQRIAGLEHERDGWRPVWLRGVPEPERQWRIVRATSSPASPR